LEQRGIDTVVHLGDLFDRRKYINFHILHRTRIDFLQKLVDRGYDTHIIIGNHDTYFRDSNDVNSVTELIHMRYPNFHVYEQPQYVKFDNLNVLILPWLNPNNMGPGLEMIKESKSKVAFGHLEIAGFHMDQNQICDKGMDRDVFKNFKMVLSGHFHHPNTDGKIRYLGSPYQMTFADLNDPRGFYIFDTDTLDLEFIKNPYEMFIEVLYDDREPETKKQLAATDFSIFEEKFVRLIANNKTDPILYEQFIDGILKSNPADTDFREIMTLDVADEADEQFIEFDENNRIVVVSDTTTILDKYVDAIGREDIDKTRMKSILRELYTEAVGVG
jgi:DNA repair exonuclease SbcCD nuclease subunit